MPLLSIPVVDRIAASMSLASLQHQVSASNIANRDAVNYQRMRLQFDRAFDQTLARPPLIVADTSQGMVSLEEDLLAMSANAAKYQAMARGLSRYFSIAAVVTNSGRG
jgi:flagellar basal body rod protein FlgB